jgi:hypothetical protein
VYVAGSHICEQGLQPLLVEPALRIEVIEKMAAAAREERRQLPAYIAYFANRLGLSLDSFLQESGNTRQISQVKKQQGAVQRLGHRALCREALFQELLKSRFPPRGDRIHRAHSTARHSFAG